MQKPMNVDAYIAQFPASTQEILKQFRDLILTNAPGAVESVSYGMPAYKLNGKPLVYFAGYEHHIGFYATPTGHEAFSKDLAKYKQGKGSVQFPLAEAMPWDLVKSIVEFRVAENLAVKKAKK